MGAKLSETKRTIVDVLRRHLGERTVLCVAIPILRGYAKSLRLSAPFDGLTEKEIANGFRELTKTFGNSDYHSTYIQRRLGPRGFLETVRAKYRFRPSLIETVSAETLELLESELTGSLRTAFERRQVFIRELEQTVRLPNDQIQPRSALVADYLKQITGNGGEMFEVVSFAVLREYFRTFGFSLHRFSTTHANDGGMDFVATEAIYQVTADESIQKVRKDLAKAPGTKRVLVRPTVSDEVIRLCDAGVLETIEVKDLLEHFIAWLLARDHRFHEARHLQRILEVALSEFRREDKAESVPA
jgi:hypothetical protein